jgi:hypothetical protein
MAFFTADRISEGGKLTQVPGSQNLKSIGTKSNTDRRHFAA